MNHRRGYKLSEEARRNISISHIGIKRPDMVDNKFRLGLPSPMKGRHQSDESKRKNRETHLGSNNAHWGKHCSEETRRKIGDAQRGEKGSNWQGGKTPKGKQIRRGIEWLLWREKVFKRDNWTCQECGRRGFELHPHHIKPFSLFPELRFKLNNGLTLCADCHRKTDTYGKRFDLKKSMSINVSNNYFIVTSASTPGLIQITKGRTELVSITANTAGMVFKLEDGTSTSAEGTAGASGTVTGVGISFGSALAVGYYPQNVVFANGLKLKLVTATGNLTIAYRQ